MPTGELLLLGLHADGRQALMAPLLVHAPTRSVLTLHKSRAVVVCRVDMTSEGGSVTTGQLAGNARETGVAVLVAPLCAGVPTGLVDAHAGSLASIVLVFSVIRVTHALTRVTALEARVAGLHAPALWHIVEVSGLGHSSLALMHNTHKGKRGANAVGLFCLLADGAPHG